MVGLVRQSEPVRVVDSGVYTKEDVVVWAATIRSSGEAVGRLMRG